PRSVRPRLDQGQSVVKPGGWRPAITRTAGELRCSAGAPLGQAAPGGDQAGRGAAQPVRASQQGLVGLLQLAARAGQLIALGMHAGERYFRRGADGTGQPVLAQVSRGRLGGQGGSAAETPAESFDEREVPKAVGSLLLAAWRASGCRAGIEGRFSRIETAPPEFHHAAAGQYLSAQLAVAGNQVLGQGREQVLGCADRDRCGVEIAGAPGPSEAALASSRPRDSSMAASTSSGCGSVSVRLSGMRENSAASCSPSRGSMSSATASSSRTVRAASCQSPASAACRTAWVSDPCRRY